MTGQIRISPDLMNDRANEYRAEAANIEGVIAKMDNLLTLLQSEWEGESSKAYAERFAQLRPNFVNAQELIEKIAKSLDDTASIMRETDDRIKNAYQG